MKQSWEGPLNKIDDYRWEIPKSYHSGMRVPGLIYASSNLLEKIRQDQALEQVANVAFLPGIVGRSLAMPDIHWGYGFCIGGVAATTLDSGVISPGGVGFDVNCGIRLVRTNLTLKEVKPKVELLVDELFRAVPSGVGSKGKIKISYNEIRDVLRRGSKWAVERGFGWEEDTLFTEEEGCMKDANPDLVSKHAMERGKPQLGTLGSGNHFLEIQVIDKVYDPEVAREMGLEEGQITVMIHCGSRGLGHQVCTDYLVTMQKAVQKYGIQLPDRQLACAPLSSPEGKNYYAAMACAANYAWANRQCIMHWTREVFAKVFRSTPEELGLKLIYDVAHNIAKIEEHDLKGKKIKLCVHRKGATRAFPPFHPDIPEKYRKIGQPVLIPGDMGRCSYCLVGTEKAMEETFGSTCHGAGRVMSRMKAKKEARGRDIQQELREKGIIVKAESRGTLVEEMSDAYKDVSEVVEVMHQTGISRKVVRMRPLGVIKG
ncbi:MAG: RtcB family protein [Atribacterota bacterium]